MLFLKRFLRPSLVVFIICAACTHKSSPPASPPPTAVQPPPTPEIEITPEGVREVVQALDCQSDEKTAAFCLRTVEASLNELHNRSGFLLPAAEVKEGWEPLTNDKGEPILLTNKLALVSFSTALRNQMYRYAKTDRELYASFRERLKERFHWTAHEAALDKQDFTSMLEFVSGKIATEKQAETVLTLYYNAYLQEYGTDPYARFEVAAPAPKSVPYSSADVAYDGENFRLSRLRPGSPADKASLQVGMRILRIGDIPLTLDTAESAFEKMNGNEPVPIIYELNGRQMTVPSWAGQPELPGVSSYVMEVSGRRIGVLEIISFYVDGLCVNAKKELEQLNRDGIQSLIIDLRQNPGGFNFELACVAGLLLGKDQLIAHPEPVQGGIHFSNPNALPFESSIGLAHTTSERVIGEIPFNFIIDASTASAAEVLAALAQDLQRSWIIGDRSFGKGIAQSRGPAALNDKPIKDIIAVSTRARLHLPSGYSFHLTGVIPEFPVSSPMADFDVSIFAERFVDRFGSAFAPDNMSPPVSEQRLLQKARIEECISHLSLADLDERERRWLADLQLRRAVEVTLCQSAVGM